jgi:C_GCAxxG_C_C family probable redox protein
MDKAKELRNRTDIHLNCAQGVTMTFADVLGISEDTAFGMGACFGSGMGMGATCGAITGALMVLGIAGVQADASGLLKKVRENHDGMTNCKDLLRVNSQKGNPKKPHCDDMVYELVELTEEILRKNGKIN